MSTQIEEPPKLLAHSTTPTSIVCKNCNEETGLTLEILAEIPIDGNICCPICEAMMYSCIPEKPSYYFGQSSNIYGEYDY